MSDSPFDLLAGRDRSGRPVVAVRGELDLATAPQVDGALREAAARHGTVVLDLSELAFMDSTGVRLLLQAARDAQAGGWALSVRPPVTGGARLTLDETGIAALLPIERTGDGAG